MTEPLTSRDRLVCVTGALGFVGSHLCRALVDRGYRVRAVDCLSGSYAVGAGLDAATELGALDAVEVVSADVAADPLEPLLDGAGAVIHLAGLPGVRSRHSFGELWAQNTRAAARVAAATGAGRRFVLASSSSVYGNAVRLPAAEECPRSPLNPYAASKVAAEGECLATGRSHGTEVVVARLFTVFGPAQRPDMAFAGWIDSIVHGRAASWCADAAARRDFTYVGDAVRGLVAALERGRTGEAYNVAGTGPVLVRDALEEIESLLGGRARLVPRAAPSEAVATAGCGAKAAAELGYVPVVDLRAGLEAQVEAAVAEASARAAA